MISMLSSIYKIDRPIPGLYPPELVPPPLSSDNQHKELKVLSALATVLVMEHEVVAVVQKHSNHGNRGVVEVFACTDSIADKETEPPPNKSFLENFIATCNPRFSDASKTKLEIHDQPGDFQNITKDALLKKFKDGTRTAKHSL